MNRAVRNQIRHLDRSLAALLDERARLAGQLDGREGAPAIEDLLRRSRGHCRAEDLRRVFAAVERATGPGAGEAAS